MSFVKRVLDYINPMPRIDHIVGTYTQKSLTALQTELFGNKSSQLIQHCFHSDQAGITNDRMLDNELIVSLTTYGERINEVALTIESIMCGTLKPNRIILWLSQDEFEGRTLPLTLQKQQQRGLQIEYVEDIRSYKKIIPALSKYPESYIITIDDDLIYSYDFVEKLVLAYIEDPNYIYAYRVHQMSFSNNTISSYLTWRKNCSENISSKYYFFTTGGGVLFPPHALDEEVLNKDVFLKDCPYADDIWMNAMVTLSGKIVKKAYSHNKNGDEFIANINVHGATLNEINNNKENCLNDIQLKKVFERYDIISKITRA